MRMLVVTCCDLLARAFVRSPFLSVAFPFRDRFFCARFVVRICFALRCFALLRSAVLRFASLYVPRLCLAWLDSTLRTSYAYYHML